MLAVAFPQRTTPEPAPGERLSEERLRLALEAGKLAIWEGDLTTGTLIWWSGMQQLHGLPAEAPPPEDYYVLVHPADQAHVRSVVADAIRFRRPHRVEYRVVWPDGSVHWLEADGRILVEEDGTARTMLGVCIDIDRRKRTETDLTFLAQASAELASLTEYQGTLDRIARLAVPHFADWCTVDMLDPEGGLVRVAVAHADPERVRFAQRLHSRFGASRDSPWGAWHVLRTGQAEFVPVITADGFAAGGPPAELLEALASLGLHSYMAVPLTAHGRSFGVITFLTAESRRTFVEQDLALAHDLARRAAVAIENARLLQAVQQSDRAKDVFLATLAHELRNPLAPIFNALAILRRPGVNTERSQGMLAVVQRQAEHLTRLVDDLLEVSRISTGKLDIRTERVSLADVLQSAIETSRPHVEAANHVLDLSIPREPIMVEADPVRLGQVFTNLLNNASRYTPPGGHIRVAVEPYGSDVTVRVRDNGIGIPADMLPHVFKLFSQVVHPSQRRRDGLGIGLYLVSGLVRLHGGTVHASSGGPGQGSEFSVTLPIAGTQPVPDALSASPSAAPANARRVLVVDDNVDAAETLAELLQMLGHHVSVAHDGASALAAAAGLQPEVVLLDIGLPDLTGYEVARRLRQLESWSSDARVVALTGWGQEADKAMAREAGFHAHWTKPVAAETLETFLRSL